MPNISKIIRFHNEKVIGSTTNQTPGPGWSCRAKKECVLEGKCQSMDIFLETAKILRSTSPSHPLLSSNDTQTTRLVFISPHLGAEGLCSPLQNHMVHDGKCPLIQMKTVRLCQLCLMEKTLICTTDQKRSLKSKKIQSAVIGKSCFSNTGDFFYIKPQIIYDFQHQT